MLKGKNILLGITGGIAAYKAAILVRLLKKEGANVKVLMTEHAKKFITPLTMATLSKNPILVDFFNPENGEWNSHVDLGLWADLYIIAPATANTMGKMAHAIADNLLVTSYLSARCPVFVAPTMDLDMYQHPANLKNIETLRSYGNYIIEAETGELASGLSGKGRMAEPEIILEKIKDFFQENLELKKKLSNKKIIITAGPTFESIDPVRFIGNYSSGKMGFALAELLANFGAKVTLISGPVELKTTNKNIHRIDVQSAAQMHSAANSHFESADVAIMAAAVADFSPANPLDKKVKREKENLSIQLKPTKDIAAELGKIKKENQVLVGFALETNDEYENAFRKLKNKNLDFIVLNSLNDQGAGFGYDTNKISIIDKFNTIEEFELKPKKEVALDIVCKLVNFIKC